MLELVIMAIGYLWAGRCSLCTALYQMTIIGLYSEELAARDRSPPCPENSVSDQTVDDSEMLLGRRNLTSRESLSNSGVEQGTRRSVGFHDEVEKIPCESFIRDAPTATSTSVATPVGSRVSSMYLVMRRESFEASGPSKADGQGEYGHKCFSIPSLLYKALVIHYPSPHLHWRHLSLPYMGSGVTQVSVQAGQESYKPKKYYGSIDWTCSTSKLCHNEMGGLN